ncbi:MAG: PocR ligand-binding domain-containing protein [Cyanobacteriota bacterium]
MNFKTDELLDFNKLSDILDSFAESTGYAIAVIEHPSQKVLYKSKWQQICTDFHRKSEVAIDACLKSDYALSEALKNPDSVNFHNCAHGLMDVSTPIIINDRLIAELFIGQFFIEKPDIQRFKEQATKYNFDETSYLEALRKVPVVEKTKFEKDIKFLSQLTRLLGVIASENLTIINSKEEMLLKQNEELQAREEELTAQNEELQAKEEEIISQNKELLAKKEALTSQNEELICLTELLKLAQFSVEKSSNSVYWVNSNGKIQYVNEKAINFFGYSKNEFLNMHIYDLDESLDNHTWKKHWEQLKVQKALSIETRYKKKNNQYANVLLSANYIKEGDKEFKFAFVIDISTRIQTEHKLKQTLEDLKRSNRELEQFAYVASHDLQEPLRMVASYVQLLKRRYADKLDTDAIEFIDYAVDGANRMKNLINDLLTFSRVGTRGKPFEKTDMNHCLNQVFTDLQMIINDSNASITNDDLPVIYADKIQMIQLFQNLISNAIKFKGNSDPVIHVSFKEEPDHWLFSVKDNGIGINSDFFDRIFIIFQRLHSIADYSGTGIGLSICKKIAERHKGKIWVESAEGTGSTFFFTIPKNLMEGEI